MAADLPECYERHPDAFQFIKEVEVDWKKNPMSYRIEKRKIKPCKVLNIELAAGGGAEEQFRKL